MNNKSLSHDFDRLAPSYDRAIRILLAPFGTERRFRQKITKSLRCESVKKGARILEIGCGTGANIEAIDRLFPGNFIFFCVDNSGQMLEQARKKKYQSQVNFLHCDASCLPFENEEFDFVLAVLVLHEMSQEKREKTAAEIFRVLKTDACTLVLDINFPSSIIGRILFQLLRLIESREALEFARQTPVPLFEKVGMSLDSSENVILDILKLYIFRKSRQF